MIKRTSILAAALVLILHSPAKAEEKTGASMQSKSREEQETFYDRIQRSNALHSKRVCADRCTGTLKSRTQPSDPFAKLPDVNDAPLPTLKRIDE